MKPQGNVLTQWLLLFFTTWSELPHDEVTLTVILSRLTKGSVTDRMKSMVSSK